ncbi:DnaA N-terminal domain-containing protein [Pyxidicoccus trucidator]|uniref:DnaA N-terminal domain-containing protein n=1 Tax=Pyxidicoccus trucidator TaxID=2709662 RepID=UPI0013D8ECC0|nr:DnaA N-terminal domain-containing protein [Pyxidicoccus trucidator]
MSLAVVGAARSLGMERRAFLGAIVELQIWAVQALPSGRFEPFSVSAAASGGRPEDASLDEAIWCEAVEGAVRWTGAPGAFWAALLRTGILVREGDSVRLTLCDRYVQVLEKRKKEAERKRRERANKAAAASGGRPADAPGTSPARRKREKETEKKSSSAAAVAMEVLVSPGHLAPVPPPPDEVLSEDSDPVQLALPGTHLVPVSLSPEERRHAEAPEPDAAPPRVPQAQAEAFFETFQHERARTFRGVPREDMPASWADWYRHALARVGGDESRLLTACRGYLHSDWGRSRQPVGTSVAFCSPKVWVRYVPHEQPDAAEPTELPSVDVSSPAGRAWQRCLTRLHEQGKRYALLWLQKARAVDVEDGRLILSVPDVYFRQWVEENYGPLVELLVRDCGLLGVRWLVPEADEAHGAMGGTPR